MIQLAPKPVKCGVSAIISGNKRRDTYRFFLPSIRPKPDLKEEVMGTLFVSMYDIADLSNPTSFPVPFPVPVGSKFKLDDTNSPLKFLRKDPQVTIHYWILNGNIHMDPPPEFEVPLGSGDIYISGWYSRKDPNAKPSKTGKTTVRLVGYHLSDPSTPIEGFLSSTAPGSALSANSTQVDTTGGVTLMAHASLPSGPLSTDLLYSWVLNGIPQPDWKADLDIKAGETGVAIAMYGTITFPFPSVPPQLMYDIEDGKPRLRVPAGPGPKKK